MASNAGVLLDEIHENASKALFAAELFNDPDYKEYAAHFSIICWEKCSKYLLVYCKDHLPSEYFRARYRHTEKYVIASGIYFLSGNLSAVYDLKKLHDSDVWSEGKDGLAALIALSLKKIGWGNPENLAKTLMEYLGKERTKEEKDALTKLHADVERIRTGSVYLDVNDDLSLKSSPKQISNEEATHWLENAKLGIGILNFLRSSNPDLTSLIESFPREFREEAKGSAKNMVAAIAEGGRKAAGTVSENS